MTALPKDAALKIARWAWPEDKWVPSRHPEPCFALRPGVGRGTSKPVFRTFSHEDIHAAEQVAVERGLDDQLGRHLLAIVEEKRKSKTNGERIVRCAYASLESRALALLRLVEELEKQ